jgi:hypothetical protein
MADIKQAAKWMGEGKKVRRSIWNDGETCESKNFRIVDQDGAPTKFWKQELLAEDWEIAE